MWQCAHGVGEATRNQGIVETAEQTLEHLAAFDQSTNELAQMAREQYNQPLIDMHLGHSQSGASYERMLKLFWGRHRQLRAGISADCDQISSLKQLQSAYSIDTDESHQ